MIIEIAKDIRDYARKTARWITGNGVRWLFNLSTHSGLGGLVVAQVKTGSVSLTSHALAYASIGLGFFINGYRFHKEYEDRQQRMLDMYRDEISVWLGKSPYLLTRDDLKRAAEGVPALNNELAMGRRRRNAKTISWAIVATASFALVFYVAPVAPVIGAVFKSFPLVTAALSSLAVSELIKRPIEKLAHMVAKSDSPGTHDYIDDISRMRKKNITPEQVLAVFVASSPEIASNIEANYGKSYHNMEWGEQRAVLNNFYRADEIKELTQQLRQGIIKPSELAWKSSGLDSGVEPLPEPAPSGKDRVKKTLQDGIANTRRLIDTARHQGFSGMINEMRNNGFDGVADNYYDDDDNDNNEENKNKDKNNNGGFVERLGRDENDRGSGTPHEPRPHTQQTRESWRERFADQQIGNGDAAAGVGLVGK